MSRRTRADSNNGLLRSALNSQRVPSSNGRSSRRDTPRSGTRSLQASQQASRDVSDDDFDDSASVMSEDTWLGEDDEPVGDVGDWEELLGGALEALGEKRAAAREKTLASIVRLMAHVYMGEGLEGRRVTLLEALRRGARSTKSARERELALRGVALWFVNFGTDAEAEAEFGSVSEQLRALATDPGSDVRAPAVAALGMANFVAGADFRDAAELAQFVQARVLAPALERRAMDEVRQALETLGLLLTVVADADAALAERVFDAALALHMRALKADSVDVRVRAAQNFALVHQALNAHAPFAFAQQDELVGVLEMLRHESSKRHGKRSVAAQRAAMRDTLRTIEAGDAPELRLALHGRVVRFGDWIRILRLHAFRAALGGGLPAHFLANALLQDVFDVEFDGSHDEFQLNKARMVVSPSSELAKLRSKDMRKRRAAHHATLQPDDE
ncbi:Interferon- developmental regulator 1 [Coemansia sp. RSA 2704]|nr:Interferon- developmental regulator 1 [Coemansia sp. RSA 2704]